MSEILLNKVISWIYNITWNNFEKFAYEALNLIYESTLQEIHANVEWSWPWDWWVDYFDLNTQTWFSVYWQEWLDEWHAKLKSKIKKDFQKVIKDVPWFKPQKWIFVCNRNFWHQHVKQLVQDTKVDFIIENNYDLELLARTILETNQGRELLYKYRVIDDFDVLLQCKTRTKNELSNPDRPETIHLVNQHKISNKICDMIEKTLIQEEKDAIELAFDEYLRNYYPLLLDWGRYSKLIPDIEKKYRENINKSWLRINQDFDYLLAFHDFLVEKFDKNKDTYYLLWQNSFQWIDDMTQKLFLNSEQSKIGCFYSQLWEGFYNISNTENNKLKLKILKNE